MVTSVSVTLSSVVRIAESKQASATALLANGLSQSVTSGWRSDTPTVASVTDAGLVTGVSNGRATIYVVSGGQQGQQNIRVLPDYEGRFSGRIGMRTCTPFPDDRYAGFCAGIPQSVWPFTFTITQDGETIAGQFTIGSLLFVPFVAPIQSDGAVGIASTNITFPYQHEVTWDLRSEDASSSIPATFRSTVHWVRRGSAGIIGGFISDGFVLDITKAR